MLPPTSMEVENDHFTKESALRQIHFPLGPAFASSEMCLQSSPFTTPASSKCQSERCWKCNLLKVVTMTNMAYYFPPIKVQQLTSWPPKLLMLKSEVSTLDLLEDLHSRKNCGNWPLIHLVALGKLLDTEFKLIAVHFVLCLLVGFSIEGRISTEQSKPVTDGSGQEKPRWNHVKSSLLDQERLQLGLKGWSPFGSNLRLVASFVSNHSQINWTRQSFSTNPLSSSHDDSTTPNITRVIVVSLQHLTSWCWKTSTKLQNIYLYKTAPQILMSTTPRACGAT